MIEISRIDAYQSFDEEDINHLDACLDFYFKKRMDRNMTYQFFLTGGGKWISLDIYYDDEKVTSVLFNHKGKLTDQAKKALTIKNA